MDGSGLWLRLFGEPALEGPGGPIALRTTRQLGILLVGLLEGPRVRREQLVPLFWPGVPDRRGRHSLTQALSELRVALPGVVRAERACVHIDGLTSDLDRLSGRPDFVDRGDILEGLDRLGGIELSQWLDAVRERIRQHATGKLELALRSRTGADHRTSAAAALLALDPTNEAAVIVLAERDLDAGRTTDAVRRLQRQQASITAELGYDPQQRVATVLRRLEGGDARRAREAITGESVRLDASPDPIVGRDAEDAALSEAWDEVCAGGRRAIRLTGGAGMGKSLHLRNFMAAIAGRGHLAFMVTCHQATRAVPFAMLADLIDALATDPGFAATEPDWLAEASRIHPALRSRFPGIPEPGDAPPESIRERLVEATVEILATIADGSPVALAFDDADQGDQASLSVIGLVSRRVRRHPLFMLSATSDPPGAEDEASLECDRHLYLRKLHETDIVKLLESRAAALPAGRLEQGIIALVANLADGNPHYALTLLDDHGFHRLANTTGHPSSQWTPPRDLMDAIARAVTRHTALARRVLAVLATAGRSATFAAIAEVADIAESDVRAAAVELLAHDRVRIAADELHLPSPLWVAAIYHLETEGVRQYLHARWATVLNKAQAAPDYERLLATARHEALAGLVDVAARHYREGAAAALATGAPGEARRALEHGMALPVAHEPRTWSLLGEALAAQGRYAEALSALDSAERLCKEQSQTVPVGDRILRLEVTHRLGLEPLQGIVDALADILMRADQPLTRTQELRALQLRAELARDTADHGQLREVLHALVVTQGRSHVETARAHLTRGFIFWQEGLWRRARSELGTAHQMLAELHLPQDAARAANGAGIAALAAGQFQTSMNYFERGLRSAEHCEDYEIAAGVIGNAALAVEDSGYLPQALGLNERATSLARKIGSARREIICTLNYSDVLLLLGRSEEATEAHQIAIRHARTSDNWHAVQGLVRLPDLAMARGDWHASVRHVQNILKAVSHAPVDRFLRSRIVRQSCTACYLTKGTMQPVDPLGRRGTWTAFGRREAALSWAWLRRASERNAKPWTPRGPPNPAMIWLSATGLRMTEPWMAGADGRPPMIWPGLTGEASNKAAVVPAFVSRFEESCDIWT